MFNVPNKYRVRNHPVLGSDDSYGNNGFFIIPSGILEIRCQASDGLSWEHVSVSLNKRKCPTWEMMCLVKEMFWDDTDTVVQFHPPKSEYVNQHRFCLHLWRNITEEVKLPPSICVGIKNTRS